MPDMYTFQAGSKPISQLESTESTPKFTPNILPCRIHHDGPIVSTERFWIPKTDEKDNKQTAHFRGRRLRGQRVAIPEGYQGIVATPTDRVLPASQRPDNGTTEDGETESEDPVKVLEVQGTFDDIMVWGHEILPAADDTFVKGVEEWVRFAETMHMTAAPAVNGN
ncbi:Ribonuclease H2 subunit C [Penicillium canariense]|uniref:Ribonuclease H2 subunit C n=1 Tax=Penicillium canariense TaxID=189055 RepID=A0A9W9HXG5_9EURO|nr:Ribonuclease H2 subunit C [Penicillium canariense]KAJ5160733.1 Ribonuclease H2 subunit C [Penicillium canariense]